MAYYALNEYQMMPWDFVALPQLHKAALIGMIQAKVEQDRKERAAAEAAAKKARR